jgi:hypothetical protein
MRRLFITLLSSIVVCLSFGQSPMVVVGDVRIASNGTMKSVGTINVKASSVAAATDTMPIKKSNKGVIVNDGKLQIDEGIIFYSNAVRDGMLVNLNENNGVVTTKIADPGKVMVCKKIKTGELIPISFPFEVDVTKMRFADSGQSIDYNSGSNQQDLYIYTYNSQKRAETGKTDGNWDLMTAIPNNRLEKGKGYMMYVNDDIPGTVEILFPAADFTNLFEYADKSVDIRFYYDSQPAYYKPNGTGWNYLGGLYTSSFTMTRTRSNPTMIENTIAAYFLNKSGSYQCIDLSIGVPLDSLSSAPMVLSPYTPFFIKTDSLKIGDPNVEALNKSLTYKKEGIQKAYGGDAWPTDFRSSQEEDEDILFLKLINEKLDFDNIYIKFNGAYKESFDVREDGMKMFSSQSAASPDLWMTHEYSSLSINGLPYKEGGREINLGVITKAAGQYTFKLYNVANYMVKKAILLDKETGAETDLLTGTYSFQANGAMNTDKRFVLFVDYSFTALPTVEDAGIYAYTDNGLLFVKNLKAGDDVRVMDLAGRLVVSGKAVSSEFSTPLAQKGVYIVNVKGAKNTALKVLNR